MGSLSLGAARGPVGMLFAVSLGLAAWLVGHPSKLPNEVTAATLEKVRRLIFVAITFWFCAACFRGYCRFGQATKKAFICANALERNVSFRVLECSRGAASDRYGNPGHIDDTTDVNTISLEVARIVWLWTIEFHRNQFGDLAIMNVTINTDLL
jgi:hypothetical protein